MTERIHVFVVVIFLTVSSMAAGATGFEYGERPACPVFDPSGTIESPLLGEISEPLLKIYDDEGIDVVVVVLDSLQNEVPGQVAERFASAWCDSSVYSVVLHVPGNPDSPWILPGGELMERLEPEQITTAVADARRRAALEPTEPGKVRAAATEAADMLRYWKGREVNRRESLKTERMKAELEREKKSRQRKIVMLMGGTAIVPSLIGLWVLYMFFRTPAPRRFPQTRALRRLGAPHAGGNHAVVELGPPSSQDGRQL